MDMGLRDAVVLVTGGTGGIGRRTALAFAAEGARVAITHRSREDGTPHCRLTSTALGSSLWG